MQSNLGRVALGIAALAAVVALFVVLQNGDEADTPSETGGSAAGQAAKPARDGYKAAAKPDEPQIPTIAIRNGKPVGGVEELTFDAGERIRFEVTSNVADEVHVHGYDVEEEVTPARPAVFDFPATIEGVFEGELHGSGEQIVELRVNP